MTQQQPQVLETLATPNSRTSAATVTTAVGTLSGQTLIVIYGSDFFDVSTMPDPTSTAGALTPVGTMDNGTNSVHAKVYIVTTTSDGAKDVTFPSHSGCDIFGVVLRLDCTVTVDVALVTNLSGGATAAAWNAPSVTTTVDACLVVYVWLEKDRGDVMTLPGTVTPRAEILAPPFSGMDVATSAQAVAGTTGTKQATIGSSSAKWGSLTVGFKGPNIVDPEPEPEPEPEPPVPLSSMGGWEQLLSIRDEARQLRTDEINNPPAACPNDGEPLTEGPEGTLFCRFDGWQYPRDHIRPPA